MSPILSKINWGYAHAKNEREAKTIAKYVYS